MLQTIEFPWGLYCLVVVFLLLYVLYASVPTEGTGEIGRFHSRGENLCKFIGKKENVYSRKEFNSHRNGLVHQHGRRFIVLEHQYDLRDVM